MMVFNLLTNIFSKRSYNINYHNDKIKFSDIYHFYAQQDALLTYIIVYLKKLSPFLAITAKIWCPEFQEFTTIFYYYNYFLINNYINKKIKNITMRTFFCSSFRSNIAGKKQKLVFQLKQHFQENCILEWLKQVRRVCHRITLIQVVSNKSKPICNFDYSLFPPKSDMAWFNFIFLHSEGNDKKIFADMHLKVFSFLFFLILYCRIYS